MKSLAQALALTAAVVCCTPVTVSAEAMTPMGPGFHQSLACTGGGSVDIRVGSGHPKLAPEATIVTTTLTIGESHAKTDALRMVDTSGNIYAIGYAFPSFVKRFPKRLLLPASPPKPGSHTMYYNLNGAKIEKRFEGTTLPSAAADSSATPDSSGAAAYVFSDYLDGHKLNTVTYVPGVGITNASFVGIGPDHADLLCHSPGH